MPRGWPALLLLGAVSAAADVWDGADDGPTSPNELTHGSAQRHDLAARPGPAADDDWYRLAESPYASYEVVVDGVGGDLAPGPVLERLASDGATVLGIGAPIGVGAASSLRWQTAAQPEGGYVRVRGAGCSTSCAATAEYRIRARETTQSVPRFNNAGSQITVLILQNPTEGPASGHAYFRDLGGTLLASHDFTLAARATLVLNTASLQNLAGIGGALTVTSDAPYGALAGKTVALEPATGFSFDSPMQARPAGVPATGGLADCGTLDPQAVPCWRDVSSQLICADPNASSVPAGSTVALEGGRSTEPCVHQPAFSWRLAAQPAGGTSFIDDPAGAAPGFVAQQRGDYQPCLTVTDAAGRSSAERCVTVHALPVPMHVQLTWNKDQTDVDLHLMRASIANIFDDGLAGPGMDCPNAQDCFFVCRTPSWGAAGTADDPRLALDDADGYGPEETYLDAPADGTYVIAAHYWCDRAGPTYSGPAQGPTTATVKLFVSGALAASWSRTLSSHDQWYVADVVVQNGIATFTTQDVVTATSVGCP